MSERTAQLYMRLAKNRQAIEEQIRNSVADLTLNEAAALLMMSSDVCKLLTFAETAAGLDGEDLINFCIEQDVGVLQGDIFGGKEPTEFEQVEWHLFILFLARTCGFFRRGCLRPCWVQSRGWLLADWMGEEGNKIRSTWWQKLIIPQATINSWNAFLENNRGRTLADISASLIPCGRKTSMPQPVRGTGANDLSGGAQHDRTQAPKLPRPTHLRERRGARTRLSALGLDRDRLPRRRHRRWSDFWRPCFRKLWARAGPRLRHRKSEYRTMVHVRRERLALVLDAIEIFSASQSPVAAVLNERPLWKRRDLSFVYRNDR